LLELDADGRPASLRGRELDEEEQPALVEQKNIIKQVNSGQLKAVMAKLHHRPDTKAARLGKRNKQSSSLADEKATIGRRRGADVSICCLRRSRSTGLLLCCTLLPCGFPFGPSGQTAESGNFAPERLGALQGGAILMRLWGSKTVTPFVVVVVELCSLVVVVVLLLVPSCVCLCVSFWK